MSKSDRILKSYRLDIETIEKISEVKSEVFKKQQKNVSYSDIVVSAFKLSNSEDLADFILENPKED